MAAGAGTTFGDIARWMQRTCGKNVVVEMHEDVAIATIAKLWKTHKDTLSEEYDALRDIARPLMQLLIPVLSSHHPDQEAIDHLTGIIDESAICDQTGEYNKALFKRSKEGSEGEEEGEGAESPHAERQETIIERMLRLFRRK